MGERTVGGETHEEEAPRLHLLEKGEVKLGSGYGCVLLVGF